MPVELPEVEEPRIFFDITPHFYGKCWSCKRQNVEIVAAAFTKPAGMAGYPGCRSDYWSFIFCGECRCLPSFKKDS